MKKRKKQADAKPRKLWTGLYTRKGPTKLERLERTRRKHRPDIDQD